MKRVIEREGGMERDVGGGRDRESDGGRDREMER